MLKILHFLFAYGLLVLPFTIKAQVNKVTPSQSAKVTSLEEQEKKEVAEAYKLYNIGSKDVKKVVHRLLKTLKTKKSLTNANLLLAYYFQNKALVDSSIYYVNKSLQYELADDSTQAKKTSLAYNILAINYKNKGLLQESKKWHLKGIEFAEKFNEEDLYYTHIHGLANTYSELGDLKKSLELFKECLQYKDDKEIIYGSYINIAIIYSEIKDFESSDMYLKKGLDLANKNNDIRASAFINHSLAGNAQEQGKLDLAISLYNKTIEAAKEFNLNQLGLTAKIDIGNLLVSSKKYKEAEIIFTAALNDAIKLGYLGHLSTIYENLQRISRQQENYKNALYFATKNFSIKDSINKLQKDKEINELEVRYQTLQKEKEIKFLQIENANRSLDVKHQQETIKNLQLLQEVQKKENENRILSYHNAAEKKRNEITLLKKDQEIQESNLERQKSIKNIILYSFLILLVPVIGLLFTYYQKLQAQSELNKKQEEINKQKISSLLKDQELKLIKASIKGQDKERKRIALELHDSIGGNLAAIKLQLNNTLINGNKQPLKIINSQIDDTYQQVRNLSHNLVPKKFSKNNFCDVLEEYLNNIGGATSLTTSFGVYPRKEIDVLNEVLQSEIFKIIQELITNTIKHAKASSIELQLNLVENVLNVLFEDNGVGFNTKNNDSGIGFENIKSRLKKVSGSLHIDSRIDRGTIIDIEIPTLITINNNEI
ncbi:tetratricopeptide repeat-containing sensor histidine kinase [Aquimarina aquimarini]|uniref:tetratricopeptide repeat-containing sensor histidine kinase n=1 Tax=Aquimarina aquimarini TaxID=1191734 RepID=UPI000D55DA82|nr:tetratricopeptide repeat-containing sensor histidine kinase [Aquimarina aquimarini]